MKKIKVEIGLNTLRPAIWLFVIFINTVQGQDMYHSPYSIYRPGLVHERTSSLNRGLAGVGIGINDGQQLNHANPASYAAIQFPVTHIFELGGYVEHNRYRTNQDYESRWNGGFSNMTYWFRLKPWIGSSISISPYSTVAYSVVTQRQLAIGQEATYIYKGSGNITSLSWGNGFRLTKNLFAGVSLSYLFGTIDRDESILTGNGNDMLTLKHKTFGNRVNADIGIQYKAKLFAKSLVAGLTYQGRMTLQGRNRYLLSDVNSDTLADYRGDRTHYQLPERFGAGISLGSKRSILAADLTYAKWSDARFPGESISFRDAWKMAIGYAWLGNEYADSYFGIIGFRMGFYYQEHYLVVKKTPMNNWGATASLSLPVADGRSRVNIAYTYDRMGTLERNLILHSAEKIHIDVIIQDVWGRRRRFE